MQIKELEEDGYLKVLKSPPPAEAKLLEKAQQNDFWEEDVVTEGHWWDLIATERGFALVKDRFEKPPGDERTE